MLAVDEGPGAVAQGPEAPASAILQGQGLAAVERAAIEEPATEFEEALALSLEVAAVRHITLGGEQEAPAREVFTALKGERASGLQLQRAPALNTRVAGRDCPRGEPHLAPGAQRLGVGGGGSIQLYLVRLDVKCAARRPLPARRVYPRNHPRALAQGHHFGLKRHLPGRGHQRPVAQLNCILAGQLQVALGIEGVLNRYTRMVRGRLQPFCGPRPVQHQLAIGRDAQRPGMGRHVPRASHPRAPLGGDKLNAPGRHATQQGRVNRQPGRIRDWGQRGHQAGGPGVVLAPGDEFEQARRGHGAIDSNLAGEEFKHRGPAEVGPVRADLKRAPTHAQALKRALSVKLRPTRGQGDPRGVDEATAVTGEAVGVGNDDTGRLAMHFEHAQKVGALGADHFVEDDRGRPSGLEMGVALHKARKFGALQLSGGVVEHDPRPTHVELVVAVM